MFKITALKHIGKYFNKKETKQINSNYRLNVILLPYYNK